MTKCHVFNFSYSASVSSPAYNVFIVFDEQKKFFSPGSSCKCPDGNLFCSHMLASLCVLYCMQLNSSTFDELLRIFPEGVLSLQSIPCPWDFVLSLDNYKYAEDA